MPCFTSTGLTAADGLCCPLLPSGKCIFKIVLVSDKWINFVVCMLCWNLLCSFIYGVYWGLRVSWLWRMYTLWFWQLSLYYYHHYYFQKARLLLENLPWRWMWRRWSGHHDYPKSWKNTSCCGLKCCFLWPLWIFVALSHLLFAANYILMSPN